ncbi:hypothetical protein Tco_0231114 [Tanacetum coccineum]
MDVGATLRFPVAVEEREKLLEFYERVSGSGCMPFHTPVEWHKICLLLMQRIRDSVVYVKESCDMKTLIGNMGNSHHQINGST